MTTTIGHIGDPVPEFLARYLSALDDGRIDDAVAAFSPDCVYAVPLPGTHETDARLVTRGAAALRDRFTNRGTSTWRHVVALCTADGTDGLVEGELVSDTDTLATFAASFQLDEDGRMSRYVAFATGDRPEPISPGQAVETGRPASAHEILDKYFHALDEGRFDAAAACFSADTMYSHPPYRHTGIDGSGRVVFRGRDELTAAFLARGRTSFDHEVIVAMQRGPHCLLEGIVTNLPNGGDGSFISSLSLTADGSIGRYVSFYCEPAVPRR